MPRHQPQTAHRIRTTQQGPDLNKNTPEQQEPICAQHTRHTTDLVRTQNTPRGHWARLHAPHNRPPDNHKIHHAPTTRINRGDARTSTEYATAIGPGHTQKTPHSQGSDTHRRGLTRPRHIHNRPGHPQNTHHPLYPKHATPLGPRPYTE